MAIKAEIFVLQTLFQLERQPLFDKNCRHTLWSGNLQRISESPAIGGNSLERADLYSN